MPSPRRSSRRDFLTGTAARDALEGFADGIKAEVPAATVSPHEGSPAPTYLLELARDAMAVEFQVLLNAGEHNQAPQSAVAALDLLEPLEAQLTVYRETSEVSRLNLSARSREVVVEPRLFQLLQLGQRIAHDTGGAYDLTSGPLSKLWGFYRRQGRLPTEAEIADTLEHVGYQRLALDEANCTARFHADSMEINLGGIGKGYALDRMAELLRADAVENFLLHGGQSSVLAYGSRAGASSEQPGWTVGLAHPLRPEVRLAEFRLHNQALGTSGSGTQFFHFQGQRYGHILDPRTGRPAAGVLSSTVIAPTAAEADALSTAFYVGGIALAESYCAAHMSVGAVLVTTASAAGELLLSALNLDDSQFTRCE